jgi:DNA segregation ATPase FtsK/SpoIIIE-like protein
MAKRTLAEDYEAAVRLVTETQRCSTSWLQRKLQLNYERAARVVELLEQRRVVGSAEHKVLARPAPACGGGGDGGDGPIAMTPELRMALELLRRSRLELVEEIRNERAALEER